MVEKTTIEDDPSDGMTQRGQAWLVATLVFAGPLLGACGRLDFPSFSSRDKSSDSAAAGDTTETPAVPTTDVRAASASPAGASYTNTISERVMTLARLRVARPVNPFLVESRAAQTLPAEAMPVQGSTPEGQPAGNVTFIVKIKDRFVQDEVAMTFRRDKDGSRARWSSWAAEHGWQGIELVSGSYSGEVIVRIADDAPPATREVFKGRSAKEIAAWFSRHDFVAYCDPNYTASVQ